MSLKSLKLCLIFFISSALLNCSKNTVEQLQDIQAAANKVDNSQSFAEWHENKDELNRLAFDDFQYSEPTEVCNELETWSDEEIVRIKELIVSMDRLYCQTSLLARANAFEAQNIVTITRRGNLTPCGSGSTQPTFGPSTAKVRDTQGGYKAITGDLNRCEIAFTFDDGPSAAYTESIFNILAKQKVTANYFTIGKNVSRLPNLLLKMEAEGHIWGNHSQTHANLPKLSNAGGFSEIQRGFEALLKVANYNPIPPFFRFPYGASTRYLRSQLNSNDVAEFFWNMDSLDWKYTNADTLYRNALKEIEREKRGIILFHDVHRQTEAVLPRLLEDLRLANYKSVFFVAKKNLTRFK